MLPATKVFQPILNVAGVSDKKTTLSERVLQNLKEGRTVSSLEFGCAVKQLQACVRHGGVSFSANL